MRPMLTFLVSLRHYASCMDGSGGYPGRIYLDKDIRNYQVLLEVGYSHTVGNIPSSRWCVIILEMGCREFI